jgi:hypothetical protein
MHYPVYNSEAYECSANHNEPEFRGANLTFGLHATDSDRRGSVVLSRGGSDWTSRIGSCDLNIYLTVMSGQPRHNSTQQLLETEKIRYVIPRLLGFNK